MFMVRFQQGFFFRFSRADMGPHRRLRLRIFFLVLFGDVPTDQAMRPLLYSRNWCIVSRVLLYVSRIGLAHCLWNTFVSSVKLISFVVFIDFTKFPFLADPRQDTNRSGIAKFGWTLARPT